MLRQLNIQIVIDNDPGFGSWNYNRSVSGGDYASFYPCPTTVADQKIRHRLIAPLNAGTWYAKVCMWNESGTWTGWSPTLTLTISASPFTVDPTITAGGTLIKATHFNQLQNAIKNLLLFRGETHNWTILSGDPIAVVQNPIRGAAIVDLRDALETAYFAAVGTNPSAYTDSSITVGTSLIRKVHMDELRSNCFLP